MASSNNLQDESIEVLPEETGPPVDTTSQDQTPLSVEGDWKLEHDMKKKERQESSSKCLPVTLKWFAILVMGLAQLASLTATKLSLLVLCHELWDSRPTDDENETQLKKYAAKFIVLCIFLLTSPLVSFGRAIWYGLRNKSVHWPSKYPCVVAVVCAFLESIGLCLLCYSVLGFYQAPISLLFMAVLLVPPSVSILFLAFCKCLRAWPWFVAIISVVAGLGATGFVCFVSLDKELWRPFVAIACLFIASLPGLQHYIINGNINNVGDDETANTANNGTSRGNASTGNATEARSEDLTSNTAWKTSIIMNGCRMIGIFICSPFFFTFGSGISSEKIFNSTTYEDFGNLSSESWAVFGVGCGTGISAYILAFAACYMKIKFWALYMPLICATGISLLVVEIKTLCTDLLPDNICVTEENNLLLVILAPIILMCVHIGALYRHVLGDHELLQQESVVFWVPGYSAVFFDGWLPSNLRYDVFRVTSSEQKKKESKVFICTTMYREEEEEMRHLLKSIRLVSDVNGSGGCFFQSHIFFDDGARQEELSEFALKLLALLPDELGLKPEDCQRVMTPYGMKLTWQLGTTSKPEDQMHFTIHLKDNQKVKGKKRWSQVMYMAYVVDLLRQDDEVFILATDADVAFTPESVQALLDLMVRDDKIGAVCARTHPKGSGPLVWYQVFEYAIGHWLQKPSEHMLGSVLCAPGCFSLYRDKALAYVLPKFSKRVETAFDFLTKDMGEDRWLCTLLVQSGWRIHYCAAAKSETYCPDQFEEFYKQRRRWIASTLANLILLMKEWKYVVDLNQSVNVFFLLYQGLLLFATLIGPGTVILIVTGGVSYSWGMNAEAAAFLQLILGGGFSLLCIFARQRMQLLVAKLYTFLYALVMMAVGAATAAEIVDDLSTEDVPTVNATASISHHHISMGLSVSVMTLYFTILAGIFLLTGLLHLKEVFCLIHGLWYLLCIPSGYLVLPIYSICNITDSSWGTREQSTVRSSIRNAPWQDRFLDIFYSIFFCFPRPTKQSLTRKDGIEMQPEEREQSLGQVVIDVAASSSRENETGPTETPALTDEKSVPVHDWLPGNMKEIYTNMFVENGFDSTLFIAGMTDTDLERLGVKSKGHRNHLKSLIAQIPAFEIEQAVPTNVEEWLKNIGLSRYLTNFLNNHIESREQMELLKSFKRKDIEEELQITKPGHVKRLKYAISKLRDPTQSQEKTRRIRTALSVVESGESTENEFWERLRQTCLKPELKGFGFEEEVKVKLVRLRNYWLTILAVSNTLWLTLILTLASMSSLTVLGTDPLGLMFMVVFGFVFGLQFLAMLLHRLRTLGHYLARAPNCCCAGQTRQDVPERQDDPERQDEPERQDDPQLQGSVQMPDDTEDANVDLP